NLTPDLLDSALPGAGFFLHALVYAFFFVATAGVVIYLARQGWSQRAWWFWASGLLLLVARGPSGAHSLRAFLLGWAMQLVTLAAVIAIISLFFRNNPLAYIGTAVLLPLLEPLADLFRQPLRFYHWNGLLLIALVAIVLGWLLLPRGQARMPSS